MDSGVASLLVKAHKEGVINVLIIKAPVLWKNYVFEDFAKITGATIVEDASGVNFKNLEFKHLGTCEKLITDKDETVVMGVQDISSHIEQLKLDGSNDSLLRLQWLRTKTAILKLGANSESELSYFRLKATDAINASRLALADGVVRGGGIALYEIADTMPDTPAGQILKKALKAPHEQIKANLGVETLEIADDVIDAARVQKNAVRNAVSLASTILTAPIVITIPKKSPEQIAMELAQLKRMPF
jgi:chaperonin GroEL